MFAKAILEQILIGRVILSFDETTFTGTTNTRRSWKKAGPLS